MNQIAGTPIESAFLRDRRAPLPSCTLSLSDIKNLYGKLQSYNRRAASLQTENWQRPAEDDGKFDDAKAWIESLFVVSVVFESQNRERIIGYDESIFLAAENMDGISSVYITNTLQYGMKNKNQNPINYFNINIDFTKPHIFDLSNPTSSPTPNNSNIQVYGFDASWVNGVYQEVMEFFEPRKNNIFRKTLHGGGSYEIFLWSAGFPLMFYILLNLDEFINDLIFNLAIRSAFYIYIGLATIFCFRLFYSYSKWVWPKIQLVDARDVSHGHRFVWATLFLGALGSFIASLFMERWFIF